MFLCSFGSLVLFSCGCLLISIKLKIVKVFEVLFCCFIFDIIYFDIGRMFDVVWRFVLGRKIEGNNIDEMDLFGVMFFINLLVCLLVWGLFYILIGRFVEVI